MGNGETADDQSEEIEGSDKGIRGFKFYIGSDYDSLQEYVFRDSSGKVRKWWYYCWSCWW